MFVEVYVFCLYAYADNHPIDLYYKPSGDLEITIQVVQQDVDKEIGGIIKTTREQNIIVIPRMKGQTAHKWYLTHFCNSVTQYPDHKTTLHILT
jgi:hypothetical protein